MSNNPLFPASKTEGDDRLSNPLLKVTEDRGFKEKNILNEAMTHDPDQAAKAVTFGAKTGMPFDFANKNIDKVEKQGKADKVNEQLKDAPATKSFMANADNARVSHDDVDNLNFFEKHVFAPLLPVVETIEKSFERGQITTRRGFVGTALQETGNNEYSRQLKGLDDRMVALGPEPQKGFTSFISEATKILAQQYEAFKSPEAAVLIGGGAGIGATVGAFGGPLAPVTAAAGTIAGGTAGLISFAFKSSSIIEGGNHYADLIEQGVDSQTASDHATWVGILNGAMEIAPVAVFTGPFKNLLKKTIMSNAEKALLRPTIKRAALTFGKTYGAGILAESSTEVLQEITNIISEETAKASVGLEAIDLTNPTDAEQEELLNRLEDIFIKTAKGMALLGPIGPGLNLRSDFILAKNAKKNEQIIEAMGDSAKASKVRERLPEKYKEFVEKVREQGPVKDIQIPADKFVEYFQSQGIDPMQAAKEISLDIEQQLPEAMGIGGDIIIPLQDYQTHVAGTEHHAGLSQDIRLQSGDMTMREAEAFESQMTEADEQLFKEFGEQAEVDATEASAFESIKAKVKQQLQDAGQTENVAENQASLSAARAVTRAKRLGRDPLELVEEKPVEIRSEVLERLREKPVDEFDLLIDRARSGRVVSEKEVKGQTLFDFLREKGGVQDVGGELAAREIATKPGQTGLIQEAGLSFDDAAQQAQEAGFFPEGERTTINELLDAIDKESRGEAVFVEGREDVGEIQVQENVEELNRLLGEAGIDLQTATNEEVRAALGAEIEARPVVEGRDGRAIIDQKLFQEAPAIENIEDLPSQGLASIQAGILGEGIEVNERVEELKKEILKTQDVWPVEITQDGFIVDGEHRYKALLELGVENIPVYVGEQKGHAGRLVKPYPGINLDVVIPGETPIVKTKGRSVEEIRADLDAIIGKKTELFQESAEKDLQKVKQSDIFTIGENKKRIEGGIYVHDRISEEARAGEKGSTLEAAEAISRGSLRTVPENESSGFPISRSVNGRKLEATKIREAEAKDLRNWAEENNLIIPDFDIRHQAAVQENQGQELGGRDNYVFRDELTGDWLKANRFTFAPTFTELFDRMALHNNAFPDTKYTLMGFSDVKGEFLPVFSQSDFVEDAGITDQEKLELAAKELESFGFVRKDKTTPIATTEFQKGDIIVKDIHAGNVVVENGKPFIFDPIIHMDTATKAERVVGEEIVDEREDIGFDDDLGGIEGVELFQAAYHGTPHIFDKFTLDHIGKGEGAQAFGWGLYFAENKDVAQFYRETAIDTSKITIKKLPPEFSENFDVPMADIKSSSANLMRDEAVNPGTLESLSGDDTYLGILSKGIIEGSITSEKGALLKVELAPKADEWLDWNKKLSEQSEKVKTNIQKIVPPESWDKMQNWTGEAFYRRWLGEFSDREMSETLRENGIPGIRYFDQASRGQFTHKPISEAERAELNDRGTQIQKVEIPKAKTGEELKALHEELNSLQTRLAEADADPQTSNFVVFDAELIEIQEFFQKNQRQDKVRGSIQFTDTETIINLFKNADLSTFLHESGHQFINELAQDAALTDAPQQIKDDFKTLLDFVGAETAEDLDISLHPEGSKKAEAAIEKQETLARAFEAYLREGKAPSVELQTAFQNFKAWLISIYRTIKNLNVEVSEELTEVFSRMIATDEEIDIAERQAKYQPVFTTAEAGGMTAAEFNKYNESATKATASAKEDLLKESIKEVTRERRKWWKEERAKTRDQVESEINEMPVYQSIHFLTTGEFLVGEIPEGLDTVRLSKQMLVNQYGKEILKRLPKGKKAVYTSEDGVNARVIADLFGFSSGDELIQAMLKAQPRVKAIENETDVRMKQKHGDMMTDGTLEEEAVDSIHQDKRADFIRTELRALSKKTGIDVLPKKVVKDAAKRIIAEKRVRDINLGQYRRSEVKAADGAARAVADGDFVLAAEEKRRQLLNHELFIEASRAKTEIESTVRYMNKFKKPGTRANIETDYLDQIDAMLERYDFKKATTLKEIERRKALNKWITEQEEDGNQVVIDEKLRNESVKRSYKDLPVEELRGLKDAIKNIEHLGRMKEKLLVAMEQRNLREVSDEVAESILSNNKVHEVKPDFAPGILKNFTKGIERFHAAHLKMEFIFEGLDGFKKLGPTWEALFAPIAEAETFEQKKMEGIIKELNKKFDAYTRLERAGWSLQKTFVEEVGQSFNKQAILSLALNWGNEGNREAIKDGYGWTDDQVNAIIANMDKRDWETVQGIWDLVDSLWPEISELQKDLTGVAPEKVDRSPFTNDHGEWAGGYYPLKYDPEQSHTAYKRDEKIKSEDLFESNWLRPHTKNGHTIERVGSAGQKVKLDLSVITEHITNVVHDLAYRRAIIDVDRLSQQPQIKDAIESTAGKEVYRLVRPWLQSIANDFREPAGALEGWLGRARTGATVVNMGLKVTTAIVQPLGFLQSVDLIGEKWAAKGLGEFFRHPKKSLEFSLERSVMMQNRQKTFDRDVRDALKKTTLRGPLFEVQQSFFYFTGLMDMTVAVPTWMGAYKKGMDEFDNNERKAIQAADQAVRMSQSAGGAKDLAQIQRGSEYHRVFTMFYSYFNVLYALFNRRVGIEKKAGFSKKSIPKLAASMMYLWFAPAILSELVAQRGPDDDDEYAEWVTKQLAVYPFQTVVGVRDIANAMFTDYGYSLTPAADAFESIAKVGKIPSKLAAGEDLEKSDVKAALLAAGYWGKLPSRQMWITGQTMYDWATGEDEPEGIVDGVRDLFFARRR